jgi:aspartate dehydrogenase
LYKQCLQDPEIELTFIYDQDKTAVDALDPSIALSRLEEIATVEVDLVVEAAHASVVAAYGEHILRWADLLAFSPSSLADKDVHERIEHACRVWSRRFLVPHGAILGLDGIRDGRHRLTAVAITTTKKPGSLGKSGNERVVLYDGPTRGACLTYPRNSNVHAALALAGLGFDRTHSRIIADPQATTNRHDIVVEGDGFRFAITVESDPRGRVTGAYTPESAYQTLRRVCREAAPGILCV